MMRLNSSKLWWSRSTREDWHTNGMLARAIVAIAAAPTAKRRIWVWLYHLGGPGLIVLGMVDSSVIPVPGSMDALTIVLAAHHRELWPYYAAMAVFGSVLGAYVTFRLARHQGKGRLRRTLRRGWKRTATEFFKKWRFWAIAVPAILPPPVPMVPFVLAAGATDYSWKRFVGAMTLGRTIRYGILAYFAALYGRRIMSIFTNYGWPILYGLIALAVLSALVGFIANRSESGSSKAGAKAA
jgi:membrane protein YqaA with SNARE-associated domain